MEKGCSKSVTSISGSLGIKGAGMPFKNINEIFRVVIFIRFKQYNRYIMFLNM